jgi:hypothetical protein
MGLCPPPESSRSQRPPSSSRSEDRDSSRRLPPMRSLPLQRIPTRSSSMMVRFASPHRLRPQVFATSRRLHPPRVCRPCFMPDPLMGLRPPEPSSSRAAVRRLRRRYPPDVEGTRIDLPAATAPTAETIDTTVHRVTLHVETIRVSRLAPYAPHRRDGTQRPSCATLGAAEATRRAQHRSHPPNDRSRPARPKTHAPCDAAEAAPPPAPHPPDNGCRSNHRRPEPQRPATRPKPNGALSIPRTLQTPKRPKRAGSRAGYRTPKRPTSALRSRKVPTAETASTLRAAARGAQIAEASWTRATLPEDPDRRSDRNPANSHPGSPAPKRKLPGALSPAGHEPPKRPATSSSPDRQTPLPKKRRPPNGLLKKPREPPRLQGVTPREKLSPRSRWFRPATGT